MSYKSEKQFQQLLEQSQSCHHAQYAVLLITKLEQRIALLEQRAYENSWTRNPDRMGGNYPQDDPQWDGWSYR